MSLRTIYRFLPAFLLCGLNVNAQTIVGNPTNNQTITQPSNTNLDVFGIFNGQVTNGYLNATLYSGADIGVQVNAAFAAGKTVLIPAGTYNYSHTIDMPAAAHGNYHLICDQGAVLNYTGSSNALLMEPLSAPNDTVGDQIDNCSFTGTSSAINGMVLEGLSGAILYNISVSGFASGDGIGLYGADGVSIYPNRVVQNKNGLHLVALTIFGGTITSNSNRVSGGVIGSNANWGIYDDATGPGENSTNYFESTFENNGVSGSSTTGDIFIQGGNGETINHSYLENYQSLVNILLGDSTHTANQPTIQNSFLYDSSTGELENVLNMNSQSALFANNYDNGSTMVYQGTAAKGTCSLNNTAQFTYSLFAFAAGASPLACDTNTRLGKYATNVPTQSMLTNSGYISMDGNDNLRGSLLFSGSTPLLISQQTLSSGSNWKLIFQGTWLDTYAGPGNAASPASYIEVSSASPVLTVSGNDTITFSLNSSNQIVGTFNRAGYNIGFLGTWTVYSPNQTAGAQPSMALTGSVSWGGGPSIPSSANVGTPFTFIACNPGVSGNIGSCSGTASLPATQSTTGYQLVCTPTITGGANGFITITSKGTSNFNYEIGIMMVNGSTSQPTTVDCVVH